MLDWWKDLFRPIYTHDPRFGKLRFLRDAHFWEGRAPFDPVAGSVEVLIDGVATGPTGDQRAFFIEVERRYADLWRAIQPRLLEESRLVKLDNPEFVLVCVHIPQAPDPAQDWQLDYETRPPSWHFTVTMRDWKPQDVLAEC